jgi:hypothetical protein
MMLHVVESERRQTKTTIDPSYTGLDLPATQRCTENLKQIFLEMKLRGLVPNFHIHVSVSELYIMGTRTSSIFSGKTYINQWSIYPMVRVTYAFYAESKNNVSLSLS